MARSRSASHPTGRAHDRRARDHRDTRPVRVRDAMTRWLGIDLGEKRVGLAVADGDAAEAIARPLVTLLRGRTIEEDTARVTTVLEREQIDELVVGLPLHASGDEGPQATLTRAWGEALAAMVGLPVAFRDERLTSHLAEARLGPMKRGRSGGPPSR